MAGACITLIPVLVGLKNPASRFVLILLAKILAVVGFS